MFNERREKYSGPRAHQQVAYICLLSLVGENDFFRGRRLEWGYCQRVLFSLRDPGASFFRRDGFIRKAT